MYISERYKHPQLKTVHVLSQSKMATHITASDGVEQTQLCVYLLPKLLKEGVVSFESVDESGPLLWLQGPESIRLFGRVFKLPFRLVFEVCFRQVQPV